MGILAHNGHGNCTAKWYLVGTNTDDRKILGKHTEFFDQISSILSRVSEHLPRICDYADLYLASDTLHSILVRTFSNLIRLFLEIHGILKHHDTSSSSSAQGRRSKLKQEGNYQIIGIVREPSHTDKLP
jgi:hypothetical protein